MSVNSFFQNIDLIPKMPDISNISFENIIDLPDNVYVHDFESNNKFQETSTPFPLGSIMKKDQICMKEIYLKKQIDLSIWALILVHL